MARIILIITTNWMDTIVTEKVKQVNSIIISNRIWFELGFMALIFFLIEFIKKSRRRSKYGAIASSAGLFYCSENVTENENDQSKEFLKKESAGSNIIRILCATGWETFGKVDSPLYGAIKGCQYSEILLAYPYSVAVMNRAQNLGWQVDQYIKEIYRSINNLSKMKSSTKEINLKFYQYEPLWKFVILDRYAWVQQYPKRRHVQSSLCYAFERFSEESDDESNTDELGDCIWNHVFRQFSQSWRNPRLIEYDFASNQFKAIDREGDLKPFEKDYDKHAIHLNLDLSKIRQA